MKRFPRSKWELSDNTIREFMTDESWPKAQKFRDKNNGWTFEPLGRKPRGNGINAMALNPGATCRNGSVASDVVEAMSASVETVEWSLGNTDL
jgi:hypothetical protein